MTRLLHRSTRSVPPVAVRGRGLYLTDANGRDFIDAAGGAAVSCLGHNHPRVVAATKAALDRLDYVHSSFFTTEPAEALAERLIESAPAGLERAYFVSGGSEAMEAGLKLARQYFLEIGQPDRRHFIARRQSYHGNTLGALAVGGNALRRAPYAPLLMPATHIAPCYAYRDRRDDETEAAYGARIADELEAEILRLGPGTVAAFVAETVAGATLGCATAVPGYFARIRAICDRHGVLLFLDEVMCGMGRTGVMFACEAEGVAPDLVAVAKGLGGGVQPIGALLLSGRIYDAIARGSGAFMHGHTYSAHPLACAAALAVQETIRDENLLSQVRGLGDFLALRLTERFGNHRHVGDMRGRGLFQAIELVEDRAYKRPFDPARKLHARVKAEAMARGLLVYPMGGTIDGARGDHIVLAPPYIATAADIDTIVRRLGDAVDAALAA